MVPARNLLLILGVRVGWAIVVAADAVDVSLRSSAYRLRGAGVSFVEAIGAALLELGFVA